jgi:membrane protease YdiL (CAAX protease family)
MGLIVAAIVWGVFALLPAWVLSSAYARTPGIRKQFSTILRPRGSLLWYFVAIFVIPISQFLGVEITRLLGGSIEFKVEGVSGFGAAAILIALTFLRVFLTSGGINEESGWRGFALPQLQRRYPVILAIGIVYFFWALWHIPYDIGLGSPVHWIILNRTLYTLLFSVLFSWVYNRTKGSILAPALFHSSMNSFGNYLPVTTTSTILLAALAVFAIVKDRMWKKLPSDDPAVYHELALEDSRKSVNVSHLAQESI